MEELVAAALLAATSKEGFNLDERVLHLRACMTEEGLPALRRLILELVDESLARAPGIGRARLRRWREFWREPGRVPPATTGYLERLRRERGRRLLKLGLGWTEAGATPMAPILLRPSPDPEQWAQDWKQR